MLELNKGFPSVNLVKAFPSHQAGEIAQKLVELGMISNQALVLDTSKFPLYDQLSDAG